jgi:hypothetical protein
MCFADFVESDSQQLVAKVAHRDYLPTGQLCGLRPLLCDSQLVINDDQRVAAVLRKDLAFRTIRG